MSPEVLYDDLPRKQARDLFDHYLARREERLAWLFSRIGETLTRDVAGLDRLWEWIVAWRTGPDFYPDEEATLPPRWLDYDPSNTVDRRLTPIELEVIDAASFFLGDVAIALRPEIHWALCVHRTSAQRHQPVLEPLEANPARRLMAIMWELADTVGETGVVRPDRVHATSEVRHLLRRAVPYEDLPD